ncbi:hypothetical protein [Tatumella sp. UCD-D_suzukii]|nr:hypothetical protein [Tatumella sp. UCD-D_suzukii]
MNMVAETTDNAIAIIGNRLTVRMNHQTLRIRQTIELPSKKIPPSGRI